MINDIYTSPPVDDADNTGHPIDPIHEGLIKRNEIIMGSGTIPTYTQRNVVLS